MRKTTRTLATLGATGALALTPLAIATPASAAPVFTGGLVNVVVDVDDTLNNNEILSRNNIAVQAAVQLVANVCPALSVQNVALLATAAQRGETVQNVDCDGEAGDAVLDITQAQRPGGRP